MKRREFLIKGGSVLLILPAGWAVTSCDEDDTSSNNTKPTGTGGAGTPSTGATGGTQPTAGTGGAQPTAGTGGAQPTGGTGGASTGTGGASGGTGGASGNTRLTFTSSVVGSHTHQFDIEMAVLNQPPAGGLSGDTSSSDGHVHTVSLSAGELGQIAGGATVAKDTSLANGHLHTFQFHR